MNSCTYQYNSALKVIFTFYQHVYANPELSGQTLSCERVDFKMITLACNATLGIRLLIRKRQDMSTCRFNCILLETEQCAGKSVVRVITTPYLNVPLVGHSRCTPFSLNHQISTHSGRLHKCGEWLL